MSIRINPAYFGPSVMKETYDLTALVYELEGDRRNLPHVQFAIDTPMGKRVFVTYRDSLSPPSSTEQTGS